MTYVKDIERLSKMYLDQQKQMDEILNNPPEGLNVDFFRKLNKDIATGIKSKDPEQIMAVIPLLKNMMNA